MQTHRSCTPWSYSWNVSGLTQIAQAKRLKEATQSDFRLNHYSAQPDMSLAQFGPTGHAALNMVCRCHCWPAPADRPKSYSFWHVLCWTPTSAMGPFAFFFQNNSVSWNCLGGGTLLWFCVFFLRPNFSGGKKLGPRKIALPISTPVLIEILTNPVCLKGKSIESRLASRHQVKPLLKLIILSSHRPGPKKILNIEYTWVYGIPQLFGGGPYTNQYPTLYVKTWENLATQSISRFLRQNWAQIKISQRKTSICFNMCSKSFFSASTQTTSWPAKPGSLASTLQ